jgi:hypothetical protein
MEKQNLDNINISKERKRTHRITNMENGKKRLKKRTRKREWLSFIKKEKQATTTTKINK